MDAAELRAVQAPLKDQYRSRPDTARTPLAADARGTLGASLAEPPRIVVRRTPTRP